MSLVDLGHLAREDEPMKARIDLLVHDLREYAEVNRASLESYIERHPDAAPLLATCVGLSQEQFKNQLQHRLGTSSWAKLSRHNPAAVVEFLDRDFQLVPLLQQQMERNWSFADVLLERHLWSRRGAGRAIGQGRRLEDDVEAVVRDSRLDYRPRTTFSGLGGQTAPCDFAIPEGGANAKIVVAVKGFNSTGSKLTDAVREIEAMSQVRQPTQFVFAVVDGIGWKSRRADLQRIHQLWERQSIDGLFTLARLDGFREGVILWYGRESVDAEARGAIHYR